MKLQQIFLPETKFQKEITEKKQIVLYHTKSGQQLDGNKKRWKKLIEKINAHYIIDRNGTVYQLIEDKYWTNHLNLELEHFLKYGINRRYLDKQSIAIALDNWGPLVLKSGQFYPIAENSAKAVDYFYEFCQKNKWKGYQYWEYYTDKQLEALKELLQHLCTEHSIPKTYYADIWDVTTRALKGEPGIFCHVSYRNDKSDPHPQIELVNLLKSL